jgi:hypothetical protein
VALQTIASVDVDAVGRVLEDADAIKVLARAIADGDSDRAHACARELLERSI